MDEYDRSQIGLLLRRLAAKDRGYASFFEGLSRESKEVHVVARFAFEVARDVGHTFDKIRHGPDPPDCEADGPDGGIVGIEVTELLDERAIRATKRRGVRVYADWTPEKITAALQAIISRKAASAVPRERYAKYLLLVHTDEPELSIDYLRRSLNGVIFRCRGCLTDVYILVSYDPRIERCPYLRLSLSHDT